LGETNAHRKQDHIDNRMTLPRMDAILQTNQEFEFLTNHNHRCSLYKL